MYSKGEGERRRRERERERLPSVQRESAREGYRPSNRVSTPNNLYRDRRGYVALSYSLVKSQMNTCSSLAKVGPSQGWAGRGAWHRVVVN